MKKKKAALISIGSLLGIGAAAFIERCSFMAINGSKLISPGDNEIVFKVDKQTKYLHLSLSDNSRDKVQYYIINPKGEKADSKLEGSDYFVGTGEKGEWKVVFDLNDNKVLNYRVWTGNVEILDKHRKQSIY